MSKKTVVSTDSPLPSFYLKCIVSATSPITLGGKDALASSQVKKVCSLQRSRYLFFSFSQFFLSLKSWYQNLAFMANCGDCCVLLLFCGRESLASRVPYCQAGYFREWLQLLI